MVLGRQLILSVLVLGIGWSGELPNSGSTLHADDGCVQFDTPASVVACDISPPEMLLVNPDQRLVQLNFPVSTLSTLR